MPGVEKLAMMKGWNIELVAQDPPAKTPAKLSVVTRADAASERLSVTCVPMEIKMRSSRYVAALMVVGVKDQPEVEASVAREALSGFPSAVVDVGTDVKATLVKVPLALSKAGVTLTTVRGITNG